MTTDVTLDIAGMTCASCAQRIERKLNKLEGVTASALAEQPAPAAEGPAVD